MIYFSCVIALPRNGDEAEISAFIASPVRGSDVSAAAAKFAEFAANDDNGAELRAKFSNVLLIVEGGAAGSYDFPDPAVLVRQQKESDLAVAQEEASRLADRAARSQVAAEAAKADADAAAAAAANVAALSAALNPPEAKAKK